MYQLLMTNVTEEKSWQDAFACNPNNAGRPRPRNHNFKTSLGNLRDLAIKLKIKRAANLGSIPSTPPLVLKSSKPSKDQETLCERS